MSENGKKQDGALKIMQALSGVDERLLERSAGKGNIKKPMWLKAWAAVLCLAILGAAWGGYQFQSGYDNNMSNGGAGMAPMSGATDKSEGTAWDGETSFYVPEGNGNQQGDSSSGGMMNQGGEASPVASPDFVDQGTQSAENSGSGNLMIDTEICSGMPTNQSEKITEEKARSLEILGTYIPEKLPEGYVFESAYWNEENQSMSIGWSRGMDYIHLSLQVIEELPETVDVNKTEMYNVNLYEIPYGQTVPKEYEEVFDNPVFAWEDMGLEIVECRMRRYQDSGDTDTPRGNFSILFPDHVLLKFVGRGTSEQIWEMFSLKGL